MNLVSVSIFIILPRYGRKTDFLDKNKAKSTVFIDKPCIKQLYLTYIRLTFKMVKRSYFRTVCPISIFRTSQLVFSLLTRQYSSNQTPERLFLVEKRFKIRMSYCLSVCLSATVISNIRFLSHPKLTKLLLYFKRNVGKCSIFFCRQESSSLGSKTIPLGRKFA